MEAQKVVKVSYLIASRSTYVMEKELSLAFCRENLKTWLRKKGVYVAWTKKVHSHIAGSTGGIMLKTRDSDDYFYFYAEATVLRKLIAGFEERLKDINDGNEPELFAEI